MNIYIITLPLLFFGSESIAQNWNISNAMLVGGPCDGCGAIFEFRENGLKNVDTLPEFNKEGDKLKITGTIYLPDGKTPAADVILYVYQTNQKGIYATKGSEMGWDRQHGYIRGWIKTGRDGKYSFYTIKPGHYPGRTTAAHIHPTILEPNGKYYWLGAYHFEGDKYLTEKETLPKLPRGGSSGILNLEKVGPVWVGNRNFVLGKNIAGYEN